MSSHFDGLHFGDEAFFFQGHLSPVRWAFYPYNRTILDMPIGLELAEDLALCPRGGCYFIGVATLGPALWLLLQKFATRLNLPKRVATKLPFY